MEIFYAFETDGKSVNLSADESAHCVKVLRHRTGDEITVVDGRGTKYLCRITDDSPKGVCAAVLESESGWGACPYSLTMAVCPTKNIDRFEWFAEKATEIGVDVIAPVIGEHSERKVIKTERIRKILLSATKQSLKGAIPAVEEPVTVGDFIRSCKQRDAVKLIAYCFDDESAPRVSINEALSAAEKSEFIILIGPEGDFSHGEAALALECGFTPVHLGESRLRTETAALCAVNAVYLRNL